MMNFRSFSVIIGSLIISSLTNLKAENWPGWRGPNGDGTSSETNLPTQWDSVTNVMWKIPVPGIGHGSPIIWEDRIFIISAIPETQERILLCYNSTDGSLLWKTTVLQAPLETIHNDNSYASGTPVTDGRYIYVSFLDGENIVVAAHDFTGKQIWIQRPGTFTGPHGHSCSPVLYNDKVIINGASKEKAFLAALSKTDGQILWKVDHSNPANSYSAPLIREMDGRMQLIYCGNQQVSSFNPEDGSRYWFVNGPSQEFCATPVYSEKAGLLFVSSSWPERHLLAIRPDGQGDVTNTHVAWRSTQGAYYVPSPILSEDYLFTTMTNGNVHCLEAATGNILWKENMGKQYPSPVLASGLVYMPNDEGVVTVFKPGAVYENVAKNTLGEGLFASPAISNGKIYIRGKKNLYCIGKR
ncbi:MAG TPA: PQQ-binding-like beta-propeller repeat protein [Prolixibacteraceae bacterium]|nr:PQQ-binding-like beta-propeller repeat protein [Prolixibacteraceae bacterium]